MEAKLNKLFECSKYYEKNLFCLLLSGFIGFIN